MKQQATVMVVDDNPLNLSLMEAMLSPEGYNVTLYDSGRTCLEAVRQKAPDVILLDAMMPSLDGFQVIQQLKADEATRMIPIVMVTSLSDMKDRVTAIEAGADDFLSKPVTKIELLARVRSLIKVKSYNDQLVESEKRYRELVQDANAIILVMNSHGKISFMNEYGLTFFGYADGELIGKTESETILPEYESTGRNLKKNAEDIKANIALYQRYTHENITKGRRRVWVDWTNRCVADRETGETGLICVGVDVTATRWAEQEKLRQHARYKRRDILNDGINRRLSQAEVLGELQQMGLVLEPPFVLTLLAIPTEHLPSVAPGKEQMEQQHRLDLLIDFLQDSDIGVAWQTPAGIAVLQSMPNPRLRPVSAVKAKSAANELIKVVSRYWPDMKINVGVAHSTEEINEVAALFEQARAALQYGPVLTKEKSVYHWQDLGCFQFIVGDLRSARVRQFIQDHLGPLLNKKPGGNSPEGLATLEALVSGDSLQVIADRLFVHKQTIVFRKKKLADTLGVDLDELETRMNLAIAMKLFSLLS